MSQRKSELPQTYKGILVNPRLPEDFDELAHEDREQAQVDTWWDRPFIRTETVADVVAFSFAAEGAFREARPSLAKSEEDLAEHITRLRENFLEKYPDGVRYEVRCLDGGAWDRSTCWGYAGSLEGAEAIVTSRVRKG